MRSATLSRLSEKLRSKIPPPEVLAEIEREEIEAEREERKRNQVAKLEAANIPPEFRNADLSECDERVRSWVARIEDGSARNLILQGDPGVGKSHSAASALIQLMTHHRGMFARDTEIMRQVRDTFSGVGTESEIVNRYSRPQFLVIDDFGKVKARDWYLPIIWEIIDNRYSCSRPTIFTMQGDSRELMERLSTPEDRGFTAAAIIDRMKDSDVVRLEGKSRRGRRA